MNWTPKNKATVFISLTVIYIIIFIYKIDVSLERFSKGSLTDNTLAIIIIILMCSFASFLSLIIIDKMFSFFKSKSNTDNEDDAKIAKYVSENIIELIDYWGGIIANDIKLTDGSLFDTNTIYNEKYLKYKKKYLELALIIQAKKSSDEQWLENAKACYMYFANFQNRIKDKYILKTGKILDLIQNEKDTDKLINKMANLDHDEEASKKENDALMQGHLAYANKFKELIKK